MDDVEPLTYVPVAGTWGKKRETPWHDAGSMFDEYLTARHWRRKADAFEFWSTARAGSFFLSFGNAHLAWEHGGEHLYRFLRDLPYRERVIVAHSHGGQVAFEALALRPAVPVRALITVDSPVRGDMTEKRAEAIKVCALHIHLYGKGWGSRMRWLGQQGAFRRKMDTAHHNIAIKGGHSGILTKAKHVEQIDQALRVIRHGGP